MRALLGLVAMMFLAVVMFAATPPKETEKDRAEARRVEVETEGKEKQQAREQADWRATRDANNMIDVGTRVVFVATMLLALAVVMTILLWRFWQVSGVYAQIRAPMTARQIGLDPETRTLPVLVLDGHVHNLDTGQVLRLGEPRDPSAQQVAISGMVRGTGLATRAAERIAAKTKDSRPGDALPGIPGTVPVVFPLVEGSDE